MTHGPSEPCPFADDSNPQGVFGSCCSFRGNPTAFYLLALGFAPLVFGLYQNHETPDDAIAYAQALRKVTKKVRELFKEAKHRAGDKEPDAIEGLTVQVPDVGWKFPVEKALKSFEATIDWYEKVAHMGFGVKAWY